MRNMSRLSLTINKNVQCLISSSALKQKNIKYSTVLQKDEKNKTTVNIADVKLHSKLKEEWWEANGPMKALHSYNLLRVPFVRDGLVQVPPTRRSCTPLVGMKILDIGCGGGILAMPLARLGADVTGVDASKELIEMAKEHSESDKTVVDKPKYLCTTIEDHATSHQNVYDGVVASEIIEHIDNDKKELFVKSCIRVLKPGGRIFFTTPTRGRLTQLTSIWAAENIIKALPKGTHQYEKLTTPNELTFLLERNGCHVESVFGILYNILQNRWMWIDSTTLFFALQAVKLEEVSTEPNQ